MVVYDLNLADKKPKSIEIWFKEHIIPGMSEHLCFKDSSEYMVEVEYENGQGFYGTGNIMELVSLALCSDVKMVLPVAGVELLKYVNMIDHDGVHSRVSFKKLLDSIETRVLNRVVAGDGGSDLVVSYVDDETGLVYNCGGKNYHVTTLYEGHGVKPSVCRRGDNYYYDSFKKSYKLETDRAIEVDSYRIDFIPRNKEDISRYIEKVDPLSSMKALRNKMIRATEFQKHMRHTTRRYSDLNTYIDAMRDEYWI